MGDNKKWTRRAAVGSIASGAGLLLFGTGGSTQITSYRDIEVNAAGEGESAVLNFNDNSSETTVESDGSQSSVYKIEDTDDIFGKSGTGEVNVTAFVGDDEIPAKVDTDSRPFDVTVGCDSVNPLNGRESIDLMFEASAPEFTITATRTTTSQVLFDCGLNYRDSDNYRDNLTNTDIPPRGDAKGEVKNSAGVNSAGDTAELISEDNKSDKRGANIGFALPPVRESSKYELEVVVSGNQVTGDWAVALVKKDGSPLTRLGNGNKDKLQNSGSNVFQYELDREINLNETIDLYLIFNTTSSGNQKSVNVDYFEVTPVGSQNT